VGRREGERGNVKNIERGCWQQNSRSSKEAATGLNKILCNGKYACLEWKERKCMCLINHIEKVG
jgi:hypothetical protein